MFNTFFKGSPEDLLGHVLNAPQSAIDKVKDDNQLLNHEELVAVVMDDFKIGHEEARTDCYRNSTSGTSPYCWWYG